MSRKPYPTDLTEELLEELLVQDSQNRYDRTYAAQSRN